MSEFERKVTESQKTGVNESGEVVRENTQRVETSADTQATVVNVIWYIYGIVAMLLGLRFVLKMFGANSGAGFVQFIYSVSKPLSMPFDAIFGVTEVTAGQNNSVFEPSILVAIVVYALIAWGVAKLIMINREN